MLLMAAAVRCRYALCMAFLCNPDFKAGLEGYLQESGVRAIILGTRRWGACGHWRAAWLQGASVLGYCTGMHV